MAAGGGVGAGMRASLNGFGWVGSAQLACQSRRKSRSALIAAGLFFAGTTVVLALDSSPDSKPPAKLSPKTFTSAQEALRVGVDDLRAGDAKSSVQALTYAAEGGEPLPRLQAGSIYASGEVVPRDDVMAYKYSEQLVESYDEDALERRDIGAISSAYVRVGVYSL